MKDKGSMAGWLSLARSLSYLGGGIEMMNNNVHYYYIDYQTPKILVRVTKPSLN